MSAYCLLWATRWEKNCKQPLCLQHPWPRWEDKAESSFTQHWCVKEGDSGSHHGVALCCGKFSEPLWTVDSSSEAQESTLLLLLGCWECASALWDVWACRPGPRMARYCTDRCYIVKQAVLRGPREKAGVSRGGGDSRVSKIGSERIIMLDCHLQRNAWSSGSGCRKSTFCGYPWYHCCWVISVKVTVESRAFKRCGKASTSPRNILQRWTNTVHLEEMPGLGCFFQEVLFWTPAVCQVGTVMDSAAWSQTN